MLIEKMSPAQIQTDLIYLRQTLLSGLCCDGSHHKQYYLDQALQKVCGVLGENYYELKYAISDYDSGIAP